MTQSRARNHSAVRDSHKMLRAIGRRFLPPCLTHGRAWCRQRDQNAAKADEHAGIRRSNSRRTERRKGRPVRQPGLVTSLGFGGLPPWADGSTPNTAGRRACIAAYHRTGCRARFGGLGYKTLYVFYRRYVEAWVTEINLQAMRGTEHMGKRNSIGQPPVRSQSGGWIAGPSEPRSRRRSARRPTRSGGLMR
jgi:hypothetical protein